MSAPDHTAYLIDEMISAKAIAARIETLAREIGQEFADTDKLVVVGLLRGSFVFIADLVRELGLPGDQFVAVAQTRKAQDHRPFGQTRPARGGFQSDLDRFRDTR